MIVFRWNWSFVIPAVRFKASPIFFRKNRNRFRFLRCKGCSEIQGKGWGENQVRLEGLADVQILIWDHNRDLIVERAAAVLSDPEAAKYVWGTGFHWYVSEEFDNVGKVHELFPDKHLLLMEGCQEGGVQLGAWFTGERYGRNMIGDLNNWTGGIWTGIWCWTRRAGPIT